jgi:hypothetical protein
VKGGAGTLTYEVEDEIDVCYWPGGHYSYTRLCPLSGVKRTTQLAPEPVFAHQSKRLVCDVIFCSALQRVLMHISPTDWCSN